MLTSRRKRLALLTSEPLATEVVFMGLPVVMVVAMLAAMVVAILVVVVVVVVIMPAAGQKYP